MCLIPGTVFSNKNRRSEEPRHATDRAPVLHPGSYGCVFPTTTGTTLPVPGTTQYLCTGTCKQVPGIQYRVCKFTSENFVSLAPRKLMRNLYCTVPGDLHEKKTTTHFT